jgi:hypothetical protein
MRSAPRRATCRPQSGAGAVHDSRSHRGTFNATQVEISHGLKSGDVIVADARRDVARARRSIRFQALTILVGRLHVTIRT